MSHHHFDPDTTLLQLSKSLKPPSDFTSKEAVRITKKISDIAQSVTLDGKEEVLHALFEFIKGFNNNSNNNKFTDGDITCQVLTNVIHALTKIVTKYQLADTLIIDSFLTDKNITEGLMNIVEKDNSRDRGVSLDVLLLILNTIIHNINSTLSNQKPTKVVEFYLNNDRFAFSLLQFLKDCPCVSKLRQCCDAILKFVGARSEYGGSFFKTLVQQTNYKSAWIHALQVADEKENDEDDGVEEDSEKGTCPIRSFVKLSRVSTENLFMELLNTQKEVESLKKEVKSLKSSARKQEEAIRALATKKDDGDNSSSRTNEDVEKLKAEVAFLKIVISELMLDKTKKEMRK